MRKYEKKLVENEVVTEVSCNTCQKDIYNSDQEYYYNVITSHTNWAADSVESVSQSEYCSYECMEKGMRKYFDPHYLGYRFDVRIEENSFKEHPQTSELYNYDPFN